MQSIKEKFIEVLGKKCEKVGILLYAWDIVDWNNIKDGIEKYLEKDEVYDSKMPLVALIADVFNELLEDFGSMTKIDTYHESVGYICERCIVYYLISKYNIPEPEDVLSYVDFFIKDGHFDEVSFIPFKYLIKPYFEDTADDLAGFFDLYVLLVIWWENFELYKKVDCLEVTEDNFNEFLNNL